MSWSWISDFWGWRKNATELDAHSYRHCVLDSISNQVIIDKIGMPIIGGVLSRQVRILGRTIFKSKRVWIKDDVLYIEGPCEMQNLWGHTSSFTHMGAYNIGVFTKNFEGITWDPTQTYNDQAIINIY